MCGLPVQQHGAPVERVIVDVDVEQTLARSRRHHFIQNRQALFSSRHVVPPGLMVQGLLRHSGPLPEVCVSHCRPQDGAFRPKPLDKVYPPPVNQASADPVRAVPAAVPRARPGRRGQRRLHGGVQRALACPRSSRACCCRSGSPPTGSAATGARSFSLALEPLEAAAVFLILHVTPGDPLIPVLGIAFRSLYGGPLLAFGRYLLYMVALFAGHAGRGDVQFDGDVARAMGTRPGPDPRPVAVGRPARLGDDPAPPDVDRPELDRRRHDRRRRLPHPLAGRLDPRRARPGPRRARRRPGRTS